MSPPPDGGPAAPFRVTLLTGVEPRVAAALIDQLHREVPGCRVSGVLYHARRRLGAGGRVGNLLRRLRQPGYARYVLGRVGGAVAGVARRAGRAALRFAHAYSPSRRPTFGTGELADFCAARGVPFHLTADVHAPEAVAFVRDQGADLGIVYGTPILKPELFELPRLGSVNVHQRKVPDYRGGGPVGLWELLDGRAEIGVTVHRVVKALDAGAVVRAATIPVGPYDTLESLGLKAHVVSLDLLAGAVADYAAGATREVPQEGPSRMYKSPKPAELRALIGRLAAARPGYVPPRGWANWRLAAKAVLFGPAVVVRNWRRRLTGTFPVVVLYHHLVSDRPHFQGIPTAQYVRQLEFLADYYDVVDLGTALARLRSGRVDRPTVVLTFDDGYAENVLTLRAAALAADGPATLFVCTARLTDRAPFDHDLERGYPTFPAMSWADARKLEALGFTFGSHTKTHLDCGTTDPDRLRDEVVGARAEAERQLGHPVPWFSFPFGYPRNMSAPAVGLARGAYDLVCSALGGENRPGPGRADWHLFRRSQPSSLVELEFLLQSLLERRQPAVWVGPPDAPAAPPAAGVAPGRQAHAGGTAGR